MQSDNLSILCVELCNQLLVMPTFNCLFKNIRLGKRSACAPDEDSTIPRTCADGE